MAPRYQMQGVQRIGGACSDDGGALTASQGVRMGSNLEQCGMRPHQHGSRVCEGTQVKACWRGPDLMGKAALPKPSAGGEGVPIEVAGLGARPQ
jgi:hypothetical protein